MKFPTEKRELPHLPADTLYKALPRLISSDTWLCFNTARRSCDGSLTGSCKPFHQRQQPPAGLPCFPGPLLPRGPPRLQGQPVGGEREAPTETIPPNPSTKRVASEPSVSPAASGLSEAGAARHKERHNKPPEQGVSRSALSKNRVFSGHGTQQRRPENTVDFISKMEKRPARFHSSVPSLRGLTWPPATCVTLGPPHLRGRPPQLPARLAQGLRLPCSTRSEAKEEEGTGAYSSGRLPAVTQWAP